MAIQLRCVDGMGGISETSPGVFATTGMMTADHMGIANDFVGRAGVLDLATGFKVVQRGAGANMSVDVGAGTAYVLNSSWTANSNTHTKYWSVINDATVNAVIGANASGNPRIDIVTLKVDTAATPDGNASNVGTIVVTAGTPAASPSAPATPSNHLLLAYVAVANGAVSIVTANITDKRVSVYLDTNPTASGLADLGMSRQAIMNGNFDIWQRGTSFTNPAVGGTHGADRFKIFGTADGGTFPTTIIHSRLSITPGDLPSSSYGYRVNVNGAGSSLGANSIYQIEHAIEHGTQKLCGASKTVTLSFYAKSDIANKKIGVNLIQLYGTGGSPSSAEIINGDAPITLTSSWVKYTKTFTTNTLVGKTFGTGSDDHLRVDINYQWGSTIGSRVGSSGTAETFVGSGNIDIAQVQLCSGDVALPFQPKSYGQELTDCMRYYQFGQVDLNMYVLIGANHSHLVYFKVPMRIAPTVVQTNVGATGFGNTPSQNAITTQVFQSYRAATATGAGSYTETWTASAEL